MSLEKYTRLDIRPETRARFDVAVASDMCVDLIVAGDVRPRFGQVEQIVEDYQLELGGSANIFACQMAKLGSRTTVIGKLGADMFGRFARERLENADVDCSFVESDSTIRTGLGVTLAEPADRAILTYLGSITAVQDNDLPLEPGELCRHWHIASYYLLAQLRRSWPEFLRKARRQGVTTSLDTNWDPDDTWKGVREILPSVDVFLPNETEAMKLSGELDARSATHALSKLGPLVVTKCGSEGAIAVRDGQEWRLTPRDFRFPVIGPVDSVGAGDNFDAGFLRAWMLGAEMGDCLEWGHHCAAASLLAAGGIEGQYPHALSCDENGIVTRPSTS